MNCPVKYSRRACEPFQTGIEGAPCTLEKDHDGDHVCRTVDGLFSFRMPCDLCIDPIDKPYIRRGARVWRACPNQATREVLGANGRTLNICEEHFKKEAS